MAESTSSADPPDRVTDGIKGKVLLADGKPLNGGLISFVPTGGLPVTPSGVIESDGTFSLVTGGSGDGAPPGDYKVRVEAPQFQTARKSKQPPFPFKYTDEDSSGLVITVRAETNRLEPIRLK
ncbi:MAG: carboxypeptidase-like regulatory domain-containing protein [Isosphaerales bacterium]